MSPILLGDSRRVKPPAWAFTRALVSPAWESWWRAFDSAAYAEVYPNWGGPARGLFHQEGVGVSVTPGQGWNPDGLARDYASGGRELVDITGAPAQGSGDNSFLAWSVFVADSFSGNGTVLGLKESATHNGVLVTIGTGFGSAGHVIRNASGFDASISSLPFAVGELAAIVLVFRGTAGRVFACNLTTGEVTETSFTASGAFTPVYFCMGDYNGDWAFDGRITQAGCMIWDNADPLALIPRDADLREFIRHPHGPIAPDPGLMMERGLLAPWKTPAAGGGPTLLSVAGALTSSGTLVQVPHLELAGALTSSGADVKEVRQELDGLVDFTPGTVAHLRTVLQALAGTLTTAGAHVSGVLQELAGTLTSSGAVTNIVVRLLSLAGTLTTAGANVLQPRIRPAGTLTTTGADVKEVQAEPAGTLTTTGAHLSEPQLELAGTLTSSGALANAIVRLLAIAGTLTTAGVNLLQAQTRPAGTLTLAGAETKEVRIRPAGTLTTTGQAIKLVEHVLVGALALAGSFSTALAAVLTLFPPNVVDAPARTWKTDAPARTFRVDGD